MQVRLQMTVRVLLIRKENLRHQTNSWDADYVPVTVIKNANALVMLHSAHGLV